MLYHIAQILGFIVCAYLLHQVWVENNKITEKHLPK
jgi:glycerol uptake facilitator-like aquaporin